MALRKKRNVKKNMDGFIFPTPLAAVLSLVVVLALSYLWLCGRCDGLGQQIKRLEIDKQRVHKQVLSEEYKWSVAISPRQLQQALDRHQLTMAFPDSARVVHVHNVANYLQSPNHTVQLALGGGAERQP